MVKFNKGFNFIEVSITLAIVGFIMSILLGVFQSMTTVRLSNQQQLSLEIQASTISFWFEELFSRLRQYNVYAMNNETPENTIFEQTAVHDSPILFSNSGFKDLTLMSQDGETDRLVLLYQSSSGCNGQRFNYKQNELLLLMDEIYVAGDDLRCKTYDARYMLGLTSNNSQSRSVSLLRGVHSFQIKYLTQKYGLLQWKNASQVEVLDRVRAARLDMSLSANYKRNKQLSLTLPIWD